MKVLREAFAGEFEWPTWLLMTGVYAAWTLLTLFHAEVAWWLLLAAGAYVTCLHGHLQHEVIHGHPTRNQALNDSLVTVPLGLWIPYALYKKMHVAHHRSPTLADPLADPESFYFEPKDWASLHPAQRILFTVNNAFFGRLVIGPFLCLAGFWKHEATALFRGDTRHLGIWIFHAVLCGAVLGWVLIVCDMPLWQYALFFVLPGLSLTLMRSYLEHRPAPRQRERTAIVEGSWITQLLFLNNNFHVIHHERPRLAWYKIPRLYRRAQRQIARRNGGYVYKSYVDIARRYGLTPKDIPVYPAAEVRR